MISQYLEIPFYINKLEENDKLKYILFNNEQLSLFKFISNDYIYYDDFVPHKNSLIKKKIFYNNDGEICSNSIKFLKKEKKKNRKFILIKG